MLTRNKRRIDDFYESDNIDEHDSEEGAITNMSATEKDCEIVDLTNIPCPKKRKTIPRVLDGTFYEIIKECDGKVEAKCKECSEIKKGCIKSTGNFLNHYKTRHAQEYTNLEKYAKNGSTMISKDPHSLNCLPPLSSKEISNHLLDFVIDTNSPYNIISSPALHTLLEIIAARKILIPKRSVFMKNVQERFFAMKTNLIDILKEQKHVCLTCDVWSSRACSFLGMTVHFLSNDFKTHSYVLAFRKLKGRQTYFELANEIDAILKDFNLPKEKITNIVTDGGSAFCKSFKEYGKGNDMLVENVQLEDYDDENENADSARNNEIELPYMQNEDGELYSSNNLNFERDTNENSRDSEPNIDFENNEHELFRDLVTTDQSELLDSNSKIDLPPQRRCLSHLLNLVSSDFDKSLSSIAKTAFIAAYNKLHALWIFTHRSSHARVLCEKILGCLLLVPCETRWNSKYYAIEKACRNEIKPKINVLINEITKEIKGAAHLQTLSTNDWAILSEYLKVMSPVAQSLNRLQSEKRGSQGLIMPILISMRYHISSLEGNNLLNTFKKTMLEVIDERFSNYFNVNELSRELVLASITLPNFKTNFLQHDFEEERAREMLKNECYNLLRKKQFEQTENEPDTITNIDDFFVSFTHRSVARRNSIENDAESEINRYLADPRTDISMLNEFLTIKELFFQNNSTLSASAAIERVFSQCALIFRPHRNRLSSENFEKTLLLKYNRSLLK